jgi:hypothetical protein
MGRDLPPPLPELGPARGPETVIPQRERVTFLVHLSKVIALTKGLLTAFAVIDGYVVLNVIPVGVPGRAVTIGCRYGRDGAWWFYDVHTGESIRPANDLSEATQQIRSQVREAAAA